MYDYTYTIERVDTQAACMDVVYTAVGRDPYFASVRIPTQSESLSDVIEEFSPVALWLSQDTPLQTITEGTTGSRPSAFTPTTEDTARAYRNSLLLQTDWTQLKDSPLSAENQNAFAVYRQALRDISRQPDFPNTVVWPEPPLL